MSNDNTRDLVELDSTGLQPGMYRSRGDKVERDRVVQAAIVANTGPGIRVAITVEMKGKVIGLVPIRTASEFAMAARMQVAEIKLNAVGEMLALNPVFLVISVRILGGGLTLLILQFFLPNRPIQTAFLSMSRRPLDGRWCVWRLGR